MAKRFSLPWISTDSLEVIARAYVPKCDWDKKYPYSSLRKKGKARNNDLFYCTYSADKIISVLRRQAKTTEKAIENFVLNEIDNGNDYIVEGYHLEPSFVYKLQKKCGAKNIKVVFVTKLDAEKFALDVKKSTTPNDWLLVLTKKEETFLRVGKMVSSFSAYLEKEAQKYKFKVFNTDQDFEQKILAAAKYLKG